MEKIQHYTFYNKLRVAPEENPALLTEVLLNPKANRERMTQIMFESFNVQAVYTASPFCPVRFGTDDGHPDRFLVTVCRTQCAFSKVRLCLTPSFVWILAGRDLSECLMKILTERRCSFTTTAERVRSVVMSKRNFATLRLSTTQSSNRPRKVPT